MFAWNKKNHKGKCWLFYFSSTRDRKQSISRRRKKKNRSKIAWKVTRFFRFFLSFYFFFPSVLFFFVKLGSSYAFAVTRSGSIVVCITGSVPGRRAILYPLLIPPPPPPHHLLPLPLHLLIHPLCR